MLEIPFVLIRSTSKLPTRAHNTDAGLDLYAAEAALVSSGAITTVATGVAVNIPAGYAGLVWPRSGLSTDHGIDTMAGVIDAGYTGEISVVLTSHQAGTQHRIEIGDKIAQLVIQPVPATQFRQVSSLPDTERAKAGFGSTDRPGRYTEAAAPSDL